MVVCGLLGSVFGLIRFVCYLRICVVLTCLVWCECWLFAVGVWYLRDLGWFVGFAGLVGLRGAAPFWCLLVVCCNDVFGLLGCLLLFTRGLLNWFMGLVYALCKCLGWVGL